MMMPILFSGFASSCMPLGLFWCRSSKGTPIKN
jgi:hypothetical protein